ncbi:MULTISPECIES: toxin-antitoxin system HicB family antitoxin [Brevundimonas]|jgi:hypothetical protein|uniref:Arc family DNA-binding protein n=1 Tax=Brevundimonas halotolerans TaxID=69670 RepID=A0A7W9A1R0_9CAUL|nr:MULTISPECIES: toxin-antitoxin system HicB family antitoxin [Brevundimonas]MAL88557.1 toxin-antitoxin system HicB family antitoxin [Brevundimonas sp.]MAL89646.1 toxin-antitoxin system HicB family antitoxin [Brevundimonas sp.]MBB5659801.1 hypothetical protein [Brevundimonas halotolerans]HAJ03724.1 toxin-antitoxin system HicB family antitoxin [Brevundimonas sp.]|tara:strand:+ start:15151 stop:15333 length:183 start_codon:yes stop_codon:yes gene_type:complete
MPKDRKAFLLRTSPKVMAAVERLAAAEFRSVNAQVEVLIREALGRRGRQIDEDLPGTDET